MLNGSLDSRVKSCCGRRKIEGEMVFKRMSAQTYRLNEHGRRQLCDPYKTCAYYVDIKARTRHEPRPVRETPGWKPPPSNAEVEKALLGRHKFGVQFIWEGHGDATIRREGGDLIISGKQVGKDGDQVTISGTVTVIEPRVLEIKGTLDTRLAKCCGHQRREGTFRFKRTGGRKYWRLQNPHREGLCHKYTCHYYIDLFQ